MLAKPIVVLMVANNNSFGKKRLYEVNFLRVMLTSPVFRSGMFTHVCELANKLPHFGVTPYLALKSSAKDSSSFARRLLGTLSFNFYLSINELMSLVKLHEIEIIHSHSPLTFRESFEIAKELSVPLVLTLHGTMDWAKLYDKAMTYAAHIIATGPEVALSAGPEYQNKISIILNGVSLEHFKPVSCVDADKEPLRIVYFGRTRGVDTKGFFALDKAIGLMRQQGIKIDARMAGHAAGVFAVNFKNCGWVDDSVSLLHWSNVAFGRGRSLREAMACGNAGLLLGQGYGGILSKESISCNGFPSLSGKLKHGASKPDEFKITADLFELNENRQLLQQLRKDSRQIAEDYFDVGIMARQTACIYLRI